MLSIPFRILSADFVDLLMEDGHSFVLCKRLSVPTLERASYVARHAFSFVLAGEQKIVNTAGEVLSLGAGQVGFVPKGIYTITDLLPVDGEFESMLFFYSAERLQESLPFAPTQTVSPPSFLQFRQGPVIKIFLDSLRETVELLETIPLPLFEAKMQEMLALLALENPQTHLAGQIHALAQANSSNLPHFLETHFDKALSVEDYANLTGRSLSSFRRDFKRHFGQSPQQWLIQKRMEKAHQLLSQGKWQVQEVAAQVGYEHLSHFTKAFKKQFQITPSALLGKGSPTF